ncbi:MAG: GH36-type glycosyl hydrolase domain-containing protein [Fibrobacterota bacterium]
MSVYGKFNDNGQFEITDPYTPQPWLHYLIRPGQPGTETFCSGVTYTGGGFDARGTHENTFIDTRIHLNDADNRGRYIYIKDVDSGEYFTNTWQPVRKNGQDFKTTLDFGAITFDSEYRDIAVNTVMFVPKSFDGWIQTVRITNKSSKPRDIEVYPYVPMHMGDALDRLVAGDNDGFFGGAKWDGDLNALVYRRNHGISVNDDAEEINGMLGNVAAFVSTLNEDDTEYETNEERFFGNRFRDLSNPEAIEKGSLSCTDQPYLRRTCGVYKNSLSLAPGETKEFAVALVVASTKDYYLQNKGEIRSYIAELMDADARKRALAEVKEWWKDHLDTLTVQTPDEKLNRAFKWLQYQCQVVYILNRMKSRFHTGYEYGWGFRDILQDVLFNLPYGTKTVKDALILISTQMFSDGISYHNFFLNQPGNKDVQASDDPVWFPNAVVTYVKETGDFSFLDEVTAYAEVHEGTEGVEGTILEHCLKAVDRVWTDRSERNLPYMKDCDWNDDLNELRKGGQPNRDVESVMVAQQLYKVFMDMIGLFRASGKASDLISEYESRAETLRDAIEKYCVDDEGYYKRALSLIPDKPDLGSSRNEFGRIFLEPQAFGINCGVADTDRMENVMKGVEEYLDTDYGAELCYPAFTDLAERDILPERTWNIEKEPPGIKENASIFMHLNAWLIQSYAKLRKGKKAVDYYLKCLPENLAADQDRYGAEPYVYPEYLCGRAAESFGRGGHTWLTGTAPTMHQSLIESIIGLKADYRGLRVDPCIDPSWPKFTVKRSFRGAVFHITVLNPDSVESGVKSITVNGDKIEGTLLTGEAGETYDVEVTLG